MDKEYIEYASKLNEFGDMIHDAIGMIPKINPDNEYTEVEMKSLKQILDIVSDKNQATLNKIRSMIVPDIIKKEHEKLTNGVQSFVRGTKLMNDSLNINLTELNKTQLLQGNAILQIGVKEVENAVQLIGDIIIAKSKS
nr:hypothetical protein [Heyndrickxia oleronia]